MENNDKRALLRPGSVSPKRNFWVRFILGAITVAFVWFFFVRPKAIELTWSEQDQLLGIAREQLVASAAGKELIEIYPPELSERTLRDGAAFVSLTLDNALRGCMIDQFQPHEPLVVNILRNVELALHGDERFPAITAEEIDRVRITISIVYEITTLTFSDSSALLGKLKPNVDGVILEIDGEDIATYLPSVWQVFPDPAEFLTQLCIKAGWDADRWRTEPYPTVQTYRVFDFGEAE
jgi:uncharacterized protein